MRSSSSFLCLCLDIEYCVLIYCSGYGLAGEFESLSETQIRTQMEVNFFGLLAVTKAAMAAMREQKPSGGLIQQVTSIGGQRGVPVSCAILPFT